MVIAACSGTVCGFLEGVPFMIKRMTLCVAALAALCAIVGTDHALAQGEPYLELLRSDIQANKVAIMTEAMMLTEEQGERERGGRPTSGPLPI